MPSSTLSPPPAPAPFTPAYSTEFCHLIRRKVATQSTPKLPCNPSESCHPFHTKVATYFGAKLPPPSERSDATCFMGNLISPGLSMPLHLEYLLMRTDSRGYRVQVGVPPGVFVPLVALRRTQLRAEVAAGLTPYVRHSCSVPRRHRHG